MVEKSLIEIINNTFSNLGSSQKIEKPEEVPVLSIETKNLQGKKILMLDDVKSLLLFFAPYLIVATGREVSFLLHDKESKEEIITKIIEWSPDIVLLDYNLAQKLKGKDICKDLRDKGFKNLIIGFSSLDTKEEFISSGASGFISKNTIDPEYTIELLAKYVKELEK